MNLQVENLDTHEVRLTIRVEEPLLARARQETARELSRQVRIPGFRPGHAPMAMVIRAIGGEEVFAAEVAERLLKALYPKALDEAGIEPYAPGQIEDIRLNADSPEVVVRVPLEPAVDLKDYRSIRLPFPEVSVSDADVENALQHLREQNAVLALAERPAVEGDAVEMDLLATNQNGEPVFRVRSARPFVLDRQRVPVPGLVDLVLGMSAGEHKETTLTLPEDYEQESLRGQTLQVVIDVRRVNSRTLPDLDDALAQTVGNFNTIDELRQHVRAQLLQEAQEDALAMYRDNVVEAFTTLADVKMPPVFIEERLSKELNEFKDRVRIQTGLPFAEWLKLEDKTEDALREEMRPQVERRARAGLVLARVAEAEGISVTDAEINEVLNNYLEDSFEDERERSEERRKLMRDNNLRRELVTRLLTNRVLDRMVAIARGEADTTAQLAGATEAQAAPDAAS